MIPPFLARFFAGFIALPLILASTLEAQMPQEKQSALAHAVEVEDLVRQISATLWDYSETALHEDRSAAYLSGLLEREGFSVERSVAGMPTAFVASYGQGSPVVGILAEYDALPGIGNDSVPERAPRADAWPHGQGCGHNLFGAASVAGAIAIKRTMEEHDISGTIRLYGTPAEETVVGKVYMAKAGVFADLDAALEWHPGLQTLTNNEQTRALNNFEVEFRGQAAHSSADPWNGRSALDAVELMNDGVNLMREHILPSTRIHYVIPSGGEAPNVVPEYARVWYYLRDENRALVEEYYEWILDIARGAALATRTEHSVKLITGVHAVLFNRPMQESIQANLEQVGAPEFTSQEQEWGRRMQRFLAIEESGFSTGVEPLADRPLPVGGGSTDVAEVSRIAPTAGFSVATAPAGVPWHSWATSASHGTSAGVKGALIASKVMALSGIDLLIDAELLDRAKEDFRRSMDGRSYVSPIPVDQPPPLPNRVSSSPGSNGPGR